ncbi:MAG: hypothetical protein QF793_02590 [Candidatus Peribacteraceae bacterium]|jgi:hypothetical protein|nr:hypothetical protein [Candidatus Peribacteraceae bacterium]
MAPLDLAVLPEYDEVPFEARTKYWLNFVREDHMREMQFLLKKAKLGNKPRKTGAGFVGWNNVMKHNVGQAAAMRVLGKALNLEDNATRNLEEYAFIHNPTIHRDKFQQKVSGGGSTENLPDSEKFTQAESEALDARSEELHDEIDPERWGALATSPEFFEYIANQPGQTIEEQAETVWFPQLLVYYIDALFDDSTLMAAHDRIERMEKRRPDLNADEDLTGDLGMKYWDAERAVSTKIQEMVWERLKENDIELESHEDVPEFIRKQIAQEMLHPTS